MDSLGSGDWSTLIRDKIVNRLAASDRFQVVLDSEKADAAMTGFGDISRGDATVVVRLITKDQRILWTDETKNNRFAKSSSSSVADHVIKDLLTPGMLNESVLKDTLIGLVEMCRAQFIVTSAMSSEVAALLETARGLDPGFDGLLVQKQAQAQKHAEAHGNTLQEALEKFDETIRQLRQ